MHLWSATLLRHEPVWQLVPEHELDRLRRLRRGRDRDSSALALGVLRLAVAEVSGSSAAEVELHRRCPRCGSDRHGPLTVTVGGRAGPEVSVSRSGELVLVAVCSAARVGVDLEHVPDDPEDDVLALVLPADLLEALRHAPPAVRCEALAEHWTRTEAVLKALRVGLAVPLAEVAPVDAPRWRPGPRAGHLFPGLHRQHVGVTAVTAPRGMRAAAAVVGHDPEPVHHSSTALLRTGRPR